MTPSVNASSSEAQQRSSSQPCHKIDSHESARSLTLTLFDIVLEVHHAVTTQPAICDAEEELDDEEVEGIALDDRAVVFDVAEEVEGDESGSDDRENEEEDRAATHWEGKEGDESSGKISEIPN